jgi:hypothetical protein
MRLMRFWLLVFMVAGLRSYQAKASVMASSNPALVGQGVVFTVQLMPPVDVTATPTGSVTFVDGSVAIGTAQLQNGVATFSTEFTTPGDHSIGAEYSGDQNFQPANSAPIIERVTSDDVFTMAVSPSLLTQHPGGSSTVKVTLFTNGSATSPPVHLSCEALPPGATCSFQASAVTPSLAGSSTAVTISSTGARTATNSTSGRSSYSSALLVPVLFGSMFAGSIVHRKKRDLLLAGFCLIGAMTMSLVGCGDTLRVIHSGTSPGTYAVRIVGNDGTLVQAASIELSLEN